jgi:hypothetical protein
MFRLIIVLLLVGLVAMAFYLGWVHISTKNSEDQSDITLSFNKSKVKESVDSVRGKIEGKGEGKGENPKGIKETTVTGKVEAIGSGEIKVKTDSEQMMTIVIAAETDMQGNPRRGDAVTVTYMTVDNRHIATSIRKN